MNQSDGTQQTNKLSQTSETSQLSGPGRKILIVEDDEDILQAVQELLQIEGYAAETAINGAVALTRLKSEDSLPDLIILDYMMPEMNGAAFRFEQDKDPRLAPIPVLLMTANAYPDVKQKQIGAKAYVRKPLDIDKFLSAVDGCLHS